MVGPLYQASTTRARRKTNMPGEACVYNKTSCWPSMFIGTYRSSTHTTISPCICITGSSGSGRCLTSEDGDRRYLRVVFTKIMILFATYTVPMSHQQHAQHVWWWDQKKTQVCQVSPFKVTDYLGSHLTHATWPVWSARWHESSGCLYSQSP